MRGLTERSSRLATAVMCCWMAGGAEPSETDTLPVSPSAISCCATVWVSRPSWYWIWSGCARRTGSLDRFQLGLRTQVPPLPGDQAPLSMYGPAENTS